MGTAKAPDAVVRIPVASIEELEKKALITYPAMCHLGVYGAGLLEAMGHRAGVVGRIDHVSLAVDKEDSRHLYLCFAEAGTRDVVRVRWADHGRQAHVNLRKAWRYLNLSTPKDAHLACAVDAYDHPTLGPTIRIQLEGWALQPIHKAHHSRVAGQPAGNTAPSQV